MKKETKIAKIIYEATRLEAKWSGRSIIPEKWEERDQKFRKQLIDTIDKYLLQEKLPTPEEAHNNWVQSYINMGWKYGKKRDVIKKTHPDILPFNRLSKDERDKDAIFLAIVWTVKKLLKELKNEKRKKAKKGKNKRNLKKPKGTFYGQKSVSSAQKKI